MAWGATPSYSEAWLEVVLLASRQDAASASPERIQELVDEACADGIEAACEQPVWLDPFDRYAAAEAAGPLCDEGDAVACLIAGWHASQEPWATFSADDAPDAAAAPERFQRACDLGLPRGCTEVGHTVLYGLGTYASRDKAMEVLRPLCEAGEAHACRSSAPAQGPERVEALKRAAELGDALSLWSLSQLTSDGDVAAGYADQACAAGVGSACVARARSTEGAGRMDVLGNGCALGDTASCVHLTVEQLQARRIDADEAMRRLGDACQVLPRACTERAMIQRGEVPATFYPGRFVAPERLERVVEPSARRCYLDRLRRGETMGGLTLDVRSDAEGHLTWMSGRAQYDDEAFQACLLDAAKQESERMVVEGGAARLTLELAFGHQAELRFDTRKKGVVGDVTDLVGALREQARPLDACGVGEDVQGTAVLPMKVARSGQVSAVDTSSLPPPVGECVADVLRGAPVPPLDGSLKGALSIVFFQPADPIQEAVTTRRTPWTGEPLTWRLLVLMVEKSEVGDDTPRLTKASRKSILEAHGAIEAWIEEHTFGQVDMVVETLSVPGPLTSALSGEEGEDRFRIEPDDIPLEWLPLIEAGRYQSIYLWAPIPQGYPMPKLGWAWGGTTLRGATFMSSALPQGSVVRGVEDDPYQVVLHEIYHTLEYRSNSLLGTRIPANHAKHRLDDGRFFNPSYLGGQGDSEFYAWVFDEKLFPSFWTDWLTYRADVNVRKEGNLAYDAVPHGGKGVTDSHQLNDTLLDFGRFNHAAWVRPESDEPWFILDWAEPVQVGRAVAHLAPQVSRPTSRVRAVAVDVRTGQGWEEVAEASVDGLTVELSWPAVEAKSLRLRVTDREEGWLACRELEVYAE